MKNLTKDISSLVKKTKKVVDYYRNGPLGDVPSINGKIVEEALRNAMEKIGLGTVTTSGLVDLGVSKWDIGLQVKTCRKKQNWIVFTRSDKKTKEKRIQDVKDRIVASLKKSNATKFILLDYNTLTGDFSLYSLAELTVNGELITFGSFLKESSVGITLEQTHFRINKIGLEKIV